MQASRKEGFPGSKGGLGEKFSSSTEPQENKCLGEAFQTRVKRNVMTFGCSMTLTMQASNFPSAFPASSPFFILLRPLQVILLLVIVTETTTLTYMLGMLAPKVKPIVQITRLVGSQSLCLVTP